MGVSVWQTSFWRVYDVFFWNFWNLNDINKKNKKCTSKIWVIYCNLNSKLNLKAGRISPTKLSVGVTSVCKIQLMIPWDPQWDIMDMHGPRKSSNPLFKRSIRIAITNFGGFNHSDRHQPLPTVKKSCTTWRVENPMKSIDWCRISSDKIAEADEIPRFSLGEFL